MEKLSIFLMIGLLMLIFVSCASYNNSTLITSYKKSQNYSCKVRQKNVFLFYEADTIKFQYRSLGTIDLSCKTDLDENEIKDRLKYLAYQNCANAIVGITTATITKNYGGDYRTASKTYVAKIYKGTAVRIEPDSLYKSNKLGNSQELSFIKNVMRYNHENNTRNYLITAGAVLTSLIFVGIFVLMAYY